MLPLSFRSIATFLLTSSVAVLLLALLAMHPTQIRAQTATPAPVPSATLLANEQLSGTITGTVIIYGLNLRAGPGTTFARIGGVYLNDELAIHGHTGDCAWLRITSATDVKAWVSGDARYVALNEPCASVPEVEPLPIATPAATTTVAATPTITTSIQGTRTATLEPPITATVTAPVTATVTTITATSTPTPSISSSTTPTPTILILEEGTEGEANDNVTSVRPVIPEGQGCVRVLNYLGPEVTITFTASDGNDTLNGNIRNNESQIFCLRPGDYTVTADAPPPWDAIDFAVRIGAGQGIDIPLVPQ